MRDTTFEERYPEYGNLVPRDIATREIFDICTTDGLSVEKDRLCVYLDLTHIPRETLDRKLGGILEIYEKFQGVDPRVAPMKIFPAVHYSMVDFGSTMKRVKLVVWLKVPRVTNRQIFRVYTRLVNAITNTMERIDLVRTHCCHVFSVASSVHLA